MTALLSVAIVVTLVCLSLAIALAALRVIRGPSAEDRVLALDLISVNAMLIVVVLGVAHKSTMYFEAALLMALFGFVTLAALGKFLLRGEVIE